RYQKGSSQFVELAIDANQARGQLLLFALAFVATVGFCGHPARHSLAGAASARSARLADSLQRRQLAEEVLLRLLELLARGSAAGAAHGVHAEGDQQRQRNRGGQITPRRVIVRQSAQMQLDRTARRGARSAIEHELAPLQLAILALQ